MLPELLISDYESSFCLSSGVSHSLTVLRIAGIIPCQTCFRRTCRSTALVYICNYNEYRCSGFLCRCSCLEGIIFLFFSKFYLYTGKIYPNIMQYLKHVHLPRPCSPHTHWHLLLVPPTGQTTGHCSLSAVRARVPRGRCVRVCLRCVTRPGVLGGEERERGRPVGASAVDDGRYLCHIEIFIF